MYDRTLFFQDERNRDIGAVSGLLEQLGRFGAQVRRVDLHSLSAEQRFQEYAKAPIPAVHKKNEMKRMFGTNIHSACWLGMQVPALVVKETIDAVGDTYLRRKSRNTIVIIHHFLTAAVAAFKQDRLTDPSEQQQERDT